MLKLEKNSRFHILVLTACLSFVSLLYGSGMNAFNFLQMNIGSRAQGMGKAYTAMSGDLNGIYYNPASVSFAYRPAMMFFHAQLYEDLAVENYSAMLPNINNFAFSLGISFLHVPAITKYEINPGTGEPIERGQFQFYDFVPQLGVSYRWNNAISTGFQIKYLQERIDEVSASGIAFDLGMLYKLPIDFLSIGAAVQNLGPGINFDQTKEKLPLTYRMGVAYQLPAYMFTFSFDAVKTINEDWQFYPGLELEFMNSVALRAGYQFDTEIGAGYNVGAGFKFLDNYQINYVFSPAGILGSTHRAEICFKLGSAYSREAYAPSYDYTSGEVLSRANENRNISYFLPTPTGLVSKKVNDQLILSWDKTPLSEAKYLVWVEIPGKTGIVKVTKTPVAENTYTFKPTVDEINLTFYISVIKDNRESEFSKPLKVKYHK